MRESGRSNAQLAGGPGAGGAGASLRRRWRGRPAIDGDTAQVGPQIAEKLHLPQVSYVAEIAVENKAVTVKRLLEDGYMTIKVQTPCLLTFVKELNDARYMSVGGHME